MRFSFDLAQAVEGQDRFANFSKTPLVLKTTFLCGQLRLRVLVVPCLVFRVSICMIARQYNHMTYMRFYSSLYPRVSHMYLYLSLLVFRLAHLVTSACRIPAPTFVKPFQPFRG